MPTNNRKRAIRQAARAAGTKYTPALRAKDAAEAGPYDVARVLFFSHERDSPEQLQQVRELVRAQRQQRPTALILAGHNHPELEPHAVFSRNTGMTIVSGSLLGANEHPLTVIAPAHGRLLPQHLLDHVDHASSASGVSLVHLPLDHGIIPTTVLSFVHELDSQNDRRQIAQVIARLSASGPVEELMAVDALESDGGIHRENALVLIGEALAGTRPGELVVIAPMHGTPLPPRLVELISSRGRQAGVSLITLTSRNGSYDLSPYALSELEIDEHLEAALADDPRLDVVAAEGDLPMSSERVWPAHPKTWMSGMTPRRLALDALGVQRFDQLEESQREGMGRTLLVLPARCAPEHRQVGRTVAREGAALGMYVVSVYPELLPIRRDQDPRLWFPDVTCALAGGIRVRVEDDQTPVLADVPVLFQVAGEQHRIPEGLDPLVLDVAEHDPCQWMSSTPVPERGQLMVITAAAAAALGENRLEGIWRTARSYGRWITVIDPEDTALHHESMRG